MTRVRTEADRILIEEREKLYLPANSRLVGRDEYRRLLQFHDDSNFVKTQQPSIQRSKSI